MDKLVGKRLDGRYEFLKRIGTGGMANVYKAYDNVEKCNVAIKVLKSEFLKNNDFVINFRNESKAIASLSHPNIVRIFDVNFGDKIQYIVMEYIDGITLKEFIDKAKKLNWKDSIYFVCQILRALQHAHDNGIVHRDIKPQNIMMLEDGTLKITDFGIARFARDEKVSKETEIGSVQYMSPEQASGKLTDAKSDIYSVGILMYEMLTGKLPFDGDDIEEIVRKQIQSMPMSPSRFVSDVPYGLLEIINRAMQKKSSNRYQSAYEMLRDIDEIKMDPSTVFEYEYLSDDSYTKFFNVNSVADSNNNSDKNIDKYNWKSKFLPILFGVASAFALVAVIIISIFFFGRGNNNQHEVELPNFVGMRYEDIKSMDNGKYKDLGFSVTEEANSQYAPGVVFEQYPDPGMKVKFDYKDIKLKVSTGPKLLTVPKVTNMSLSDAQAKLRSAGFTNIRSVEKDDKSITAEYVIATDPKASKQVPADTLITIYYSSSRDKVVKVPNVVGQSIEKAKSILKESGFDVNIVDQPDYRPKGMVLSQNVSGMAPIGSTVTLYVSVNGTGMDRHSISSDGSRFEIQSQNQNMPPQQPLPQQQILPSQQQQPSNFNRSSAQRIVNNLPRRESRVVQQPRNRNRNDDVTNHSEYRSEVNSNARNELNTAPPVPNKQNANEQDNLNTE